MSEVDWGKAPEWADRLVLIATGIEVFSNGLIYEIDKLSHCHQLEFELIEMRPGEWKRGEERMEQVGQNGNDGEHYAELENNKSKYHREIKRGVFVDVYDVLNAFSVTNPAMQHAVKKALAPGKRGVKDTIQDMKEAIQSIERAIEMEQEK